jgi:hypothetical protein
VAKLSVKVKVKLKVKVKVKVKGLGSIPLMRLILRADIAKQSKLWQHIKLKSMPCLTCAHKCE